jgi:formylmethanofuran dehydrogenase subunit C
MTGGTILVDGDAGNEIGLSMRRGLIAIGRAAGDMLGFNMIAGTILVLGDSGIRPGAGMKRGTIGLLGPSPPAVLPSFRLACTTRLTILAMILRHLQAAGLGVAEDLLPAEVDLYSGDLVALGKGEIFLRARHGS